MKVLIVDDEEMIRAVLREYIEFEGGEADEAQDGMEAVKKARENDYDIILMDVMMPALDGFSAVKEIRKFKDIPVIMLTAKGTEYDKVLGLDSGADDYISKPFGMMELLSRIKAVLRRAERQKQRDDISWGGISISPSSHTVRVNGSKAELTLKEFNLLLYLMENEGIVLDRDSILNTVWGYSFDGENRTVDVHIRHLREKLGDEGQRIETVKGVGYRFRGSDE